MLCVQSARIIHTVQKLEKNKNICDRELESGYGNGKRRRKCGILSLPLTNVLRTRTCCVEKASHIFHQTSECILKNIQAEPFRCERLTHSRALPKIDAAAFWYGFVKKKNIVYTFNVCNNKSSAVLPSSAQS